MALRGENIGTAYVRVLADGKGFSKSFKKQFDESEKDFEQAGKDANIAYQKGFASQTSSTGMKALDQQFIDNLRKGVGKYDAQGHQAAAIFNDGFENELKKAFGKDLGKRLFVDFEKDFREGRLSVDDFGAALENLRPRISRANAELEKQREHVRQGGRDMDRLSGRLFKLSDGIGVAFGRGSRNNFLNFFGSMTRNISSIAPRLVGVGENLFDFVKSARTAGGLSGGVGKGFASLASSAGAFALALTVLIPVLAIAISTMSLLLGVVTALAATITFTLIAAIGALVGTLGPLVAGIGLATGAFLALDDAAKNTLKESLKPLGNAFKELGQLAADIIFTDLDKSFAPLAKTIQALNPLVKQIATAIRATVDGFVKMMASPAVLGFIDAFGDPKNGLGAQTRLLGDIFNQSFKIILGLLVALQPLTTAFLTWVDEAFTKFGNFLATEDGQRKMVEFFDQVSESAKSFGNFVGAVTGLIAELFDAGSQTGDNIFDKMAGSIEGFTQKLDENPEILQKWFDDAEEFADKLGEIFEAVGDIVETLSSEEFRDSATTTFGLIAGAIELVGGALNFGMAQVRLLGNGFIELAQAGITAFDGLLTAVVFVFDRILTAADAALGWIPKFGPKIGEAKDKFREFGKQADTTLADLKTDLQTSQDKLNGISKEQRIKIDASELAAFNKMLDTSISKLRTLDANLTANILEFGRSGKFGPNTASGGIFDGAQARTIAEAGPEAVVPLNRPLSQVDPAVRALSAFAQGLPLGNTTSTSTVRSIGDVTIITPTEDPRAVAAEVINQLAASAYI